MSISGQRSIFCTVRKEEDLVSSTAVILSKKVEAQARLIVGAQDYLIREATWEISKAANGVGLGTGQVREAIGGKANTGINSVLAGLLETEGGAVVRAMFFECVKGLMQAETCLYRERGYADQAAYEAYWMDKESSGCRFYVTHKKDAPSWFEHVGPYQRTRNLFNRSKSYILSVQDMKCTIQGTFTDSYHEMACEVVFDRQSGIIRRCDLWMYRTPGESCLPTVQQGSLFVGKDIRQLTRKNITQTVGGAMGCYHLADLLADLLPLALEV